MRSWILKLFDTVVRSDAAEELQEAVLALNLPKRWSFEPIKKRERRRETTQYIPRGNVLAKPY